MMSKMVFITGVLTVVVLLLLSPSTAEIKTITITSDTRPLILFEKFGFTYPGRVAIAASSVAVVAPSSQSNLSRLGFFLISEKSLPQFIIEMEQNPTFCILNSPYTSHLFTFLDLPPPPATFNRSYSVTISDEYSLFFANCVPESSVSMEIHTEFFNLNRDASRNYLSSGHTNLPSLLFLFSFAYFSFFLAFSLYPRHVSKRSLERIHLLMPQLLLATGLSHLFAALDMHHVKLTGTHGWDVFFFNFDLIRVVLLFSAVILVGTRWTFLHPLVRERGKKVLFLVIPLQVLACCAYSVIHDTGPYIINWVTWNHVFLLLDLISCFAVVFLVVWSMRSLRKITEGEPAAAMKFSLIKRFNLVVIGYLFFTRFVMFAFKTVLSYEYQWVSNLVEETATLVFCIAMFYVFGLLEKDEYSVIGDEEEQVSEIVVKE
ncbi:hypothetical protein JHK87_026812 [Glycine soja]|nr:hypothetical protein JHK87_026812 [Glycine soja]